MDALASGGPMDALASGGPMDALASGGPMDALATAAPDAAPACPPGTEEGAPCTPPGKTCAAGRIACSSGKAACVESGNAPSGTMCGPGMVCKEGACGACLDGDSCGPAASPCHQGVLRCGAGTPECMDTGANAPNGKSCAPGKVCTDGACLPCAGGGCPGFCAPGAKSCQGTSLRTCNAGGTAYTEEKCAVSCDASALRCVNCQPQTEVCDGQDNDCNGMVDEGNLCPIVSGSGVCMGAAGCRLAGCNGGFYECTGKCIADAQPCGTGCGPGRKMCGSACVTMDTCCSAGKPGCATCQTCNGGTCIQASDESPCGGGQVCRSGRCVAACTPTACTTNPDSQCHTGLTSCATGLCNDDARKTDGTRCGNTGARCIGNTAFSSDTCQGGGCVTNSQDCGQRTCLGGRCGCPAGKIDTGTTCISDGKPGSECASNDECNSRLCFSSHCCISSCQADTAHPCLTGTCSASGACDVTSGNVAACNSLRPFCNADQSGIVSRQCGVNKDGSCKETTMSCPPPETCSSAGGFVDCVATP
jgi:Notch-like protein